MQAVRGGRWVEALRLLNGQAMPALLDALEGFRAAGLLSSLSDHVDETPGISAPRTWAAILAVQLHLGERSRRYAETLPDDQRNEITHHCFERIVAG
jgi:hypothetical protein